MDRYIIYCTPEQTKKALELGAPIEYRNQFNMNLPHELIDFVGESGKMECAEYAIPTAEQMISWLEEQGIDCICIDYNKESKWLFFYPNCNKNSFGFNSRKEATLAAIDAALEYLTNNKK